MNSSKTAANLLVILLTMTSGCADAISFLALGQVLTAAMTGNTVFLGLSIVHANGLKPLGYVVALSGFILGVAFGAIIVRKKRNVTGLNPIVTVALSVELAAFVLFGLLISFVNSPDQLLLVIILSFGMGVQGVVARRIGVNGVPTTVITSTTTGLIESLVWNIYTRNAKMVNKNLKSPSAPYSSIFIWVADIVIYGVGAAICGAFELKWNLQAIWLPAAIIFAVVLSSVYFQLQVQQKNRLKSENTISG
ncbi:YoaK family protein [Heyndrickxia acidicola]|uniref:YoaK family protein n=1 Tax=Heyndrickxia acidicola TaxID=209389 RepID=A0ABU6ME81_9BACI|nr:YoaK family protein [Heyndrickxia acidicola]MED1202749.1 YoaK family protein [Heyndrickxia acidicola]